MQKLIGFIMLIVPILEYFSLPVPSRHNQNYLKIVEISLFALAIGRVAQQIYSKEYANMIYKGTKALICTAAAIKVADWYSFETMAKFKRYFFPSPLHYLAISIMALATLSFKRFSEKTCLSYARCLGLYAAVLLDYKFFANHGQET